MHRAFMPGAALAALLAVAGCAGNDAGTTASAGTSGSSGSRMGCIQGNFDPGCTDASRLGLSGNSGGMRGGTDLGVIDDPMYRTQPRRQSGNRPGAGVPAEPDNAPPSLSTGSLSGDAGKRTTGEPGGN